MVAAGKQPMYATRGAPPTKREQPAPSGVFLPGVQLAKRDSITEKAEAASRVAAAGAPLSTRASLQQSEAATLIAAATRDWQRRKQLAASGAAGVVAESTPSETSTSSRKLSRKAWQFGVDGKEFHYFLSHKKEHSKHGSVPGHVALNLHDSLQLLGFRGWCDVDNLQEISKEGLRTGIEACCCMIVLINDESHLSDWCTFEWETARELEIPIRVVVDLERGNKAECITHAASFPGLLRFQWLELTPKMRREMLGDLLTFLHEYASANPAWALPSALQELSERGSQREKFNASTRKRKLSFRDAVVAASAAAAAEDDSFDAVDGDGATPPGQGWRKLVGLTPGGFDSRSQTHQFALGTLEDGTPMWYPPLNVLMLLGGLDLNPLLHGRPGRLWHAIVFSSRYFCLGVCIFRAILFRSGPTYTDWLSVTALIAYHIHLLYAPRRLIATLRSPALTKVLARAQSNETSAELLDELFSASRKLFYVGRLATLLLLLAFFLGWLPLYWNKCYLDADASLGGKLFSIISGTLFTVGIITLIPLGVCIHILSALLMMLSTMSIEAAADSIHPSVAQLGLRRIVEQERSEVVGESPYRFSLWSSGENERRWLAGRLHMSQSKREIITPGSSRSTSPDASSASSSLASRRVSFLPGIDEDRSSLGESSFGREDSFAELSSRPSGERSPRSSSERVSLIQANREESTKATALFRDDDRRSIPPLKLTDNQLVAFQRQWSHGTRVYQQIQAELRPIQDVFLAFSLLCLFLPLELAFFSVTTPDFSLDGGCGVVVDEANTLRVLLIWIMPSLGLFDLICAARCTARLRSTTRSLVALTYARPHDRTIVDHIIREPDLCTWHITSLELTVGPRSLLVPLAFFIVSAVPWAWVRFTAVPGAGPPPGSPSAP